MGNLKSPKPILIFRCDSLTKNYYMELNLMGGFLHYVQFNYKNQWIKNPITSESPAITSRLVDDETLALCRLDAMIYKCQLV